MYKVRDFIEDLEPWQRSLGALLIIIAFAVLMLLWGRAEFAKTFSTLPGSDEIAAANEESDSKVLSQSSSRNSSRSSSSSRTSTVAPPALSNIFITEGNGMMVDFKTTGVSSFRYMVTWQNLDNPTQPPVKDGSMTVTMGDAPDGTQAGSAKLTNLKYAFGRYEVRICENNHGECGIRSNPIYLTVTRVPECDDPSVECPPIRSSKMTYNF